MVTKLEEEFMKVTKAVNILYDKDVEEKGEIKGKKRVRKNLKLIHIYIPEELFRYLEAYKPFKKFHNLGGIPTSSTKGKEIKIDTEIVNPRKRKRKTIIYIREEKS